MNLEYISWGNIAKKSCLSGKIKMHKKGPYISPLRYFLSFHSFEQWHIKVKSWASVIHWGQIWPTFFIETHFLVQTQTILFSIRLFGSCKDLGLDFFSKVTHDYGWLIWNSYQWAHLHETLWCSSNKLMFCSSLLRCRRGTGSMNHDGDTTAQ